jgi:AraC-like DNA-binding protein
MERLLLDGRAMRSFISLPTNRLDRFKIADGLYGWDHDFPRETCEVPCQSIGLEIGVVLRGERHCVRAGGSTRFTPDAISVFELGDRYTTRYEPPADGRGREVGVVLRVDKHPQLKSGEVAVRFPEPTIVDVRLMDLFAQMARAIREGETLPNEDIDREVLAFLERHARFDKADALERARLALHGDFDKALYMRHFAEIAGVHEATFTRRFAARYGITPTRYRTRLRLSEASLLLATRQGLSVREIARRVGFDDVPYFHRAIAAAFGRTPLGLQRGFVAETSARAANDAADMRAGAPQIHTGSR